MESFSGSPGVDSLLVFSSFVPVFIVWYFRTVKNWRLFVTCKSVTYHITTPYSMVGTSPLPEIDDHYMEPSACGLRCTRNVWLAMQPSNLAKYVDRYNRPKNNCLVLRNVENADEFIAAVKRVKVQVL